MCVCVCVIPFVCVGAVAALVTTPLDVAKTRIMLAKVSPEPGTAKQALWRGGLAGPASPQGTAGRTQQGEHSRVTQGQL